MLAALRLLQLLRSPSCLAGCSRSSRKAALTRSGLPSRPQGRRRGCWTKRGEVESAEDAFGARGLASPGPLLNAFRCPRCTHLETWTFYEPLVSGTLFVWRCTGKFRFTTRIFTAPCIWQSPVRCILRPDSLVFGVRHWSTRVWICLEHEFWYVSVFSTPWFDSGYMLGVSLRGAVFSLIVGRPVSPGIMEFLDRIVRCPLRNDTPHGPDSADVRVLAVLGHSCRGPDSEHCLEVLQLLFIDGRRHPRLCTEADPDGPGCSENHRDSPVHGHSGRFPCCAGRPGSHGQVVDETVVLPQFLLVEKIVARRKLQFPQLQFFLVVVVAQRPFPLVLLFSRPRDSTVPRGRGFRRPCLQVVRVPQVPSW